MSFPRHLLVCAALAAAFAAPASEAKRKLLLVSSSQMDQMGAEAFEKLKATDKLSRDPKRLAQSQCVVAALVKVLPEKLARQNWEVQVFDDPNPNAFALPGGKVGVNTGMFALIKSQDELAAVIGHEIAHVAEQHANQRISRQMLVGVGLEAVGAYTGQRTSPERAKATMGLLGLGAQVGVMLPNSREQEAEADRAGQDYYGPRRLQSRGCGAAVATHDVGQPQWRAAANPVHAPRPAEPHPQAGRTGPRPAARIPGRARRRTSPGLLLSGCPGSNAATSY